MAFGFRTSASVMEMMLRQLDIKPSLHPLNSCHSGWDGTHGEVPVLKYQFVMLMATVHSLVFSPGRFFAANEVKALLAHMVVTYDMKFEEGKGAPPDRCVAGIRIPGLANVMFRERQK